MNRCDGCNRELKPEEEGEAVKGMGILVGCKCGTINIITKE